ncbi:MAG: hypothetical protein ACREYF_15330 [Gammaproteobacteria bacterium]
MTRRKVMISLAALLAAVIGIEVFVGGHDRSLETAKARSAEPPLKAVDTSIEFPPVDRYSEFVERPLFSNTRRVFQPRDKTPLDPSGAITAFNFDLELSGITLSGTHKLALIKTKRDNAQHRVGQGEEFRGWTLEEVLADKVVMQNGAQTQELALIRKGDPLAAKRKKLQKQAKKRTQPRSAQAKAREKEARKLPRREARAKQQPPPDAAPAESESDEEE